MIVFGISVDMALNHDRGVNDGGDGINIRTNGSDNTKHFAPEIRNNTPGYTMNPSTGNPETESWSSSHGLTDGKNVLYLKDDTVTSYNRFVVSPHIPGLTLSLEATAAGIALGGWEEKDVEFIRGLTATNPNRTVSTGTGTDVIAGVAGFVQFDAKSNTPNQVDLETGTFTWNVNTIKYGGNEKTNGVGKALETDPVTIFTILEVPKYAWDVSDSANDDKTQPWVSALEFAIDTAGAKGSATPEAALTQLTTYLHSGHGLTYDVENGASGYLPSGQFDVANYMTKTGRTGSTVNCYDQAAAVMVFGRLLGIEVQFAYSDPFGFINTTTLVGNIVTNNPFFNTPNPGYSRGLIFSTTSSATYPLIENFSGLLRTSFGNHASAEYNGTVYDACAGPVTGDALLTYFGAVIDFDANKQYNQKYAMQISLGIRAKLPEKASGVDVDYFTITIQI